MTVRHYPPSWKIFGLCQLDSHFFPIKKRFFEIFSKKPVDSDQFLGTFWAPVGKSLKGDPNYLGKSHLFYYISFEIKIFWLSSRFWPKSPCVRRARRINYPAYSRPNIWSENMWNAKKMKLCALKIY